MAVLPQPVIELIESFARLPGIGPKSASRLVFHLLRQPQQTLSTFGEQLSNLRKELKHCAECQNITLKSPCTICGDPGRDRTTLCVVEDPLDVVALEKSQRFRGRYHVLHGVLSPIDGIGPEQLKFRELSERLAAEPIHEVIIATNPTVEGEATALYLTRLVQKKAGVIVTRLAHGLPVGADLEYADEVTLARALDGRQTLGTTDSLPQVR